MRLWVQSLSLLSGLRIWPCCELWWRSQKGSDLALLWLWCRLAAAAPIQPLAWEPPYAVGAALKKKKKLGGPGVLQVIKGPSLLRSPSHKSLSSFLPQWLFVGNPAGGSWRLLQVPVPHWESPPKAHPISGAPSLNVAGPHSPESILIIQDRKGPLFDSWEQQGWGGVVDRWQGRTWGEAAMGSALLMVGKERREGDGGVLGHCRVPLVAEVHAP